METNGSRPVKSRSSVRHRENFEAAVSFLQNAFLCPAIAMRICREPLVTAAWFLGALAAVTVIDFFFGGFFSAKLRTVLKVAAFSVMCFAAAFMTSGLGCAFAAAGVMAAGCTAVCVLNERCDSAKTASLSAKFPARLSAAVIALAIYSI